MTPITDVFSLLRYEEGDRLVVYDDYNGRPLAPGSHLYGNPTIGVGRALNIKGITQAESDRMLTDDVQGWYAAFPDAWFTALDPVRQAAIVSMAHAMGAGGVRGFTGMIAAIQTALQTGEWKPVRDAVLLSKWAGEESERATRCANMLAYGTWPIV
jgi:lysozyme